MIAISPAVTIGKGLNSLREYAGIGSRSRSKLMSASERKRISHVSLIEKSQSNTVMDSTFYGDFNYADKDEVAFLYFLLSLANR